MTCAPKSDSTVAAAGAAMKLAQSRTLRPSKMPSSIVALLPSSLLVLFLAGLVSCRSCFRGVEFLFARRQTREYLTDVGGAMQCVKYSALGGYLHPEERPLGCVSKDGPKVAICHPSRLARARTSRDERNCAHAGMRPYSR